MTNMSPQVPALNRGFWSHFEDQVRNWAVKDGDLYICTGGVLKDSLKAIGHGISVPDVFYKVILHVQGHQVKGIGFLVPNEKIQGQLKDFAVSIDSVEKVAGLDFYPELPDSTELILEKTSLFSAW